MSYTYGKRVNLKSQTTNQKGDEMSKKQGVQFGNDVGLYEGEYKDGTPNGQGTFTWSNGLMYEGEWKNGFTNGQGTYSNPDGIKYVGRFYHGEKTW